MIKKLSDLRVVIALFLGIVGVILLATHFLRGETSVEGIALNLWEGVTLLVVSAALGVPALLSQKN